MRRGTTLAAAGGALALVAALWLPWFDRRLSSVFAPVRVHRPVSGWSALGGLSMLLVAVALVAVAWVGLRGRLLSAVWLVVGGALALLAEVAVTVARVGAADAACCDQAVTTTAPAAGLAVAFAGAVAVLLAGMAALVGAVRSGTGPPT